MNIIPISGRAGSGKDTTAETIKEILHGAGRTVLIIHYADLLKFTLTEFLNWDGKKDRAGRELLQTVGTDIVRAQNPDYWVDYIVFMLKNVPVTADYVLIPDARFPNEISRLKDEFENVKHLRVIGREAEDVPDAEWKHHSSETSLDSYPYDIVIHNDGTTRDLTNACRALLWLYYDEDV